MTGDARTRFIGIVESKIRVIAAHGWPVCVYVLYLSSVLVWLVGGGCYVDSVAC